MSNKFIQFKIDDETIEERKIGKSIGLGVPIEKDISHYKLLIECYSNAYSDCSQKFVPKGTELEDDFSYFINSMGQLLQYVVNSTSWQQNKLYDFDKFEFTQRLENMKRIINMR